MKQLISRDKHIFLFDLSFPQLQELIKSWGELVFRAKQVWEWTYKKLAGSFDEMSDVPKYLREKLKQEITFTHLTPHTDLLSSDGWTRKILFDLHDKSQVETVLMGYEERRTACISTQAGCGLGCTFCATGQAGLQRNITAGEIVEQVLFFDRVLQLKDAKLTNLVFMGMGEPFANYKEVMKAVDILTDPNGYNFGARRITISTVGLVPMIEQFAEEKRQVNLAVSLHAATNELRETMLPINKKYPLEVLIPACRDYTVKTHRRISFEWALINNVNDTREQAKLLVKILKGMLCHVNFIPLNPTIGYKGQESTRENIRKFREILTKNGIPNTLRIRRGIDIHAGCGQLRQEAARRNKILHT
ncbi:MAG: 23S rRNA (adenine(2503)-C(2))-methyltransferase RlmN [Ignavibacteriae bacterium]|nr:MAG: 23S rRNA (adenine(2503)-C(2))-methyltransferase RlmN [Ignavibacteriota bacterium]